MAQAVQTSEGIAQVEYQLALPKKKYLAFDRQKVTFVESFIEDDIYGMGHGRHIFRTEDTNFLAALKTGMSSANPTLKFRLGFGSATNTYWLPWQEHLIVSDYGKFEGVNNSAGHLIIIQTQNNFARILRTSRVVSRKGTISSMAAAIATDAGMESVVEETDGQFMLIQSFKDDVDFLVNRLRPRAVNKTGTGGYLCYIRDNVLHFHTLAYQSGVKQMDYYNAFGLSLEASDLSQTAALWNNGIAGVTVVAQDPATGDSKEIKSDPTKAIKLADGIYDVTSVTGGSTNFMYHLGYNPVVELNALAQSMYQDSRRQTFKVMVTMQKTIAIRHGDILNLSLSQQSAKSNDYAGYYLVASVGHTIKKHSVTSVYKLERGETQPQRGERTVQGAQNQLTPISNAPGKSPNLKETQNSELTRGAGKSGPGKTFKTAINPQTGLPY